MNRRALAAVLRAIETGKMARGEAAARLECSERHVNRLMKRADVRRPPSKAAQIRRGRALRAEGRRLMRAIKARDVVEGKTTLEDAARFCSVTTRTMYRWVEKLAKNKGKERKPSAFGKK